MTTNPASRIATMIVALEAVAIFVLAGMQVVAITRGDTASIVSAIALIVLTVVIGAGTAAFAWGILTEQTWGRSGGTVAQLMILAIALGSVTGLFPHPWIAAILAAPALVTLVLLFFATKRTAALEEQERTSQAEADGARE